MFWMQQAISVKEQQFDQQINQAINKAAYRIERNQNAYLMSTMFSQAPQLIHSQSQNISATATQNDSIVIEFSDYWNQNPSNKNVIVVNTENNAKVKREVKNGMERTSYGFDTLIVQGNTTQRIQTYSSVIKPNNRQEFSVNKEGEVPVTEIKEKLNTVMDQMILEFSVRDVPIYERLGHSVIKPTLKYELNNISIPLEFEYAVTNYAGKPYSALRSKNFVSDKKKDLYKTILFPNDIIAGADQLSIYFPEKRSFIFGSLLWLFIGSLLFTLIIILTFYYTLRTILNQKRVSEIKTDFINNMTHEFKTPIATISLAADAITNPATIGSEEKISRFTRIIKEENKRMNRQVESVLKMALIDKKDFNLSIKEVYVHSLIEQAVNNISIQIEQKSGTISKRLEAVTDLVNVDETHFVNIIYNLLDNANKYTLDTPPVIELATYSMQGYFVITVTDNGIGMDAETQDRVFEKFYRYSTGNVHTVKGFGLGLSYVKAIVHAFNGNITIKSEKGKGSTFTIRIPH